MWKLRRELLENQFNIFKICERCSFWREGEPQIKLDVLSNGVKVKKTIFDGELIYEKE